MLRQMNSYEQSVTQQAGKSKRVVDSHPPEAWVTAQGTYGSGVQIDHSRSKGAFGCNAGAPSQIHENVQVAWVQCTPLWVVVSLCDKELRRVCGC